MNKREKLLKEAREELARSGGNATKKKHGRKHFQKMGKLSWKNRKVKKLK